MAQLFFPLDEFETFVRGFILGGLRLSPSTPSRTHLGLVFQSLLLEIPDLPETMPRWKEEIVVMVQRMVAKEEIRVKGDYSLPVSLVIETV